MEPGPWTPHLNKRVGLRFFFEINKEMDCIETGWVGTWVGKNGFVGTWLGLVWLRLVWNLVWVRLDWVLLPFGRFLVGQLGKWGSFRS